MTRYAIRLVLTTLSCAAWAMPAVAEDVYRYVVRVDPSLRELTVEASFPSAVTEISARSGNAWRYLDSVSACGSGAPIEARGRRLRLPASGIRCLSYSVDLAAAATAERRNAALAAGNVIVSPATWLWRPSRDAARDLRVRFETEPGTSVSVPWVPLAEPDSYRVPRSPGSATAPAVFGRFDVREVEVAGATLRVAVLRGKKESPRTLAPDALADWVRAAAQNVTLAYGWFPNPSPQVVVVPVDRRGGDSPVPFGRVVRDGGETVELFVDTHAPVEALHEDWTATHEFSHLMIPYLRSRHRWISEGFAQYYQNVLLARAGRYSEQHAWQKLYEGFERGRQSGPGLSPNEAAERRRGGLMKMYWSGAALALAADIELRRRSGGRQSLDAVLEEFARCCLPAGRAWSGPELLGRLDELVDEPVFMPLYRQHADSPEFPDVGVLFAQLGVVVENGRVSLDDDGGSAAIREAMTARRYWR